MRQWRAVHGNIGHVTYLLPEGFLQAADDGLPAARRAESNTARRWHNTNSSSSPAAAMKQQEAC